MFAMTLAMSLAPHDELVFRDSVSRPDARSLGVAPAHGAGGASGGVGGPGEESNRLAVGYAHHRRSHESPHGHAPLQVQGQGPPPATEAAVGTPGANLSSVSS